MYIKSAEITNIRSIDNFKIEFENPAGWHVLIGDNGSGKSTIIRSLALALVGPEEARALWEDWRDWLSTNSSSGTITLVVEASEFDERPNSTNNTENNTIYNRLIFTRDYSKDLVILKGKKDDNDFAINPFENNWGDCNGWFSVAYGPYRRFTGGDADISKIFANKPKLGGHLSAFGENVALTEPIRWLIDQVKNVLYEKIANQMVQLHIAEQAGKYEKPDVVQVLENIVYSPIVDNLKKLINSSGFLPNDTTLEDVSFENVLFKDGNGNLINISQLSDGYRSILSLTFELIRQLIRVYGEEAVFKNIRENDPDKMYIDLPGVVLIDEIDAHLHPTWQTKIGQWFLKYFPNLQFIVTTHSPLVCRAAIKGTIWKLAEPGSGEKSKEITGIDRDRLIYGNLLEAYGTGAFEEDVSPSENSENMLKELADLSKKSFKGVITDSEKKRMNRIKEILPAS